MSFLAIILIPFLTAYIVALAVRAVSGPWSHWASMISSILLVASALFISEGMLGVELEGTSVGVGLSCGMAMMVMCQLLESQDPPPFSLGGERTRPGTGGEST